MEVSQWRNLKFLASLLQDLKNGPQFHISPYSLKKGVFCLGPAAAGPEAPWVRN